MKRNSPAHPRDTKYEWCESYSVGNPIIDRQHAKFLNLCAEAARCEGANIFDGKEMFHAILHEMAVYAKGHFAVEEKLLRARNCPTLSEHLEEHADFQVVLCDLLVSATQGNLDRTWLTQHLSEWWVGHILGSDMACKPYLADM